MMKSIFDKKYDEGVLEGKAKGKIEALLTVIRTRFHRVPKDVERTLRQMSDPIALDSWTVHAATCRSMKKFAEALR